MMTAAEIRQTFFDFFKQKNHVIVPSAPIVVKNDPTLLFTNAGMNQFKDYFLGHKVAKDPRVADTQKCLRVSGKHNDLEEVGHDSYHHTMFEMLGNWSLGNPDNPTAGYFKEEAIAWAWELMTEVYKLPKEQLYVTVFEGDQKDNLPQDEEALSIWKKHIAADHILFGNKKDNFWEMGATGPCGPCSEIHIDCRPEANRAQSPGKDLVNEDHPEVIEIWNLVFMEFNRLKDRSLTPLPAKCVDTGMGLERLVRILQNKSSNYDTDLFSPIIAQLETLTHITYSGTDKDTDIAIRVIADHIRAISFSIADGQLPSNIGAGYVIRRILRRAVRYYFSFLQIKHPLLHQLVPTLATAFKNTFPELQQQVDFVEKVIREEELAFLRTLEDGIKRITDYCVKTATKEIDGKTAFELYDTYGFPLDLSQLLAQEKGFTIDQEGFKAEMQKQKNRSRKATSIDAGDWIEVHTGETPSFVGYDDLLVETQILKYRKVKTGKKESYQVVLATTPFYAESGGQVGDTGLLKTKEENIPVFNTKKENDLILHYTQKLPTHPEDKVTAEVNMEERLNTMYNHTATHLLHAALKEVIGHHVNQKGSLVSPEVLRFDVSHFSKMTDEELHQVEMIVNQKIREDIAVNINEMSKKEAIALGATALFGEKYGDQVRVVTIDPNFSIELCGGTHVSNTGMIGVFIITSESAVAAGVRRIEALTGSKAMAYMANKIEENKAISALLKTQKPVKAIEKLLQEKNSLQKKVEQLQNKQRTILSKTLLSEVEKIREVSFVGKQIEADSAADLKKICFDIKGQLTDYVVVLTAAIKNKAIVSILIDEKLAEAKDWNAGQWIKQQVAPLIQGGGGGQKTLATAGGKNTDNLQEVIHQIRKLIS
ncbi:MAG TPA: alanine--tRNA ligase [Chitinophagaceae bacterium]|nr:alanine--tRNA ligase [Chitinophagaceae bacterium]